MRGKRNLDGDFFETSFVCCWRCSVTKPPVVGPPSAPSDKYNVVRRGDGAVKMPQRNLVHGREGGKERKLTVESPGRRGVCCCSKLATPGLYWIFRRAIDSGFFCESL